VSSRTRSGTHSQSVTHWKWIPASAGMTDEVYLDNQPYSLGKRINHNVVPDLIRDPFAERYILEMDSGLRRNDI